MDARGQTNTTAKTLRQGDILLESRGKGKQPYRDKVISVVVEGDWVLVTFEGRSKPVRMLGGAPVRIYAVDGR